MNTWTLGNVTFKNGFASDYDDMVIWLGGLSVGSKGYRVDKDTKTITPCEVKAVIFRYDYADEDKYSAAINTLDGDVMGEFVTDDLICYVSLSLTGEDMSYSTVKYCNCEYC